MKMGIDLIHDGVLRSYEIPIITLVGAWLKYNGNKHMYLLDISRPVSPSQNNRPLGVPRYIIQPWWNLDSAIKN